MLLESALCARVTTMLGVRLSGRARVCATEVAKQWLQRTWRSKSMGPANEPKPKMMMMPPHSTAAEAPARLCDPATRSGQSMLFVARNCSWMDIIPSLHGHSDDHVHDHQSCCLFGCLSVSRSTPRARHERELTLKHWPALAEAFPDAECQS